MVKHGGKAYEEKDLCFARCCACPCACGGHGRFSLNESLTTIAAAGKTVQPGGTLDKVTRDRDIAAIALFAIGLDRPQTMSARIPANLFADTPGEARSFYKDPLDGIISPVMWIVTQFWKG